MVNFPQYSHNCITSTHRWVMEHEASQTAKTFGSPSIRYRADTFALDRYLIDVDPRVFAIWGLWVQRLIYVQLFTWSCSTWYYISNNCDLVVPHVDIIWVKIGSGNGLLPDSTKSLPGPIINKAHLHYLTHWDQDKMAHIFQTTFWKDFLEWKYINLD